MTYFFKKLKKGVKRLVRKSPLPILLKEKLLFALKLGYWPNLDYPRSFTEKLHFRKLYDRDRRIVSFSDKVEVRNLVAQKIGEEYLIPTLFQGQSLDPKTLLSIGDQIVVKRNDDSGSVCVIEKNDLSISESVCRKVNGTNSYGKSTNEWWYQEIVSQIIVEQKLRDIEGEHRPLDYKFFVFGNQSEPYCFLEILRRLDDGAVECAFFDSDYNILKFNDREISFRGCVPFTGQLPSKDSFLRLKDVALRLGAGLNFVRVDLYLIQGKVYFGEMTFCPAEGRTCFNSTAFDFFLGEKWGDSLYLNETSLASDLAENKIRQNTFLSQNHRFLAAGK
jgi:TupA-like ATPgrasp